MRTLCARCPIPVRRDCAIDAILKEDKYIIRAGIRFVPGMPRSICLMCLLPLARPGRLCLYCATKRECVECGVLYAAEDISSESELCSACGPTPRKVSYKNVFPVTIEVIDV